MWVIDTEFTILSVNAPFLAFIGTTEKDAIGKKCYDLFSHEHCRTPACPGKQILCGACKVRCRPMKKMKDGKLVEYTLTACPLRSADGRLMGILSILNQPGQPGAASRPGQVERAAQSADRAKADFLANMSHEIRTPLNGIIGLIEIIQDTELDPCQLNLFSTLLREANSLLWIINSVLDLSKIEAHKLELEHIPFDIRMTIEDVAQSIALRASQKHLELIVDIPVGMHTQVLGDPTRLRQILVNLLGNAVKFTHEGEVYIGVKAIQETADQITFHFEIRDTGIGIPREKLDVIFDSFTQANSSTTREYGGTGLGTTISKQLVEMMHGQIGVKSREGEGTTFWFSIAFPKQNQTPVAARPELALITGQRILLLDAHQRSRDHLRSHLVSWGCQVQVANDAKETVTLLELGVVQETPVRCLIIGGLETADNGFDLAKEIRQNPSFAFTQVILLVDAGKVGDGKSCRDLGIRAYLTKPIRVEDLHRTLELVMVDSKGKKGHISSEQMLVTKHYLAEERRLCGRILLAEDYPTNQQVALTHLRIAGYYVDLAENGLDAVEAFRKHPYDLILMDVQMPEMDGFDATQEIRRIEKERHENSATRTTEHPIRVPIVGMSAHTLKGFQDRFTEIGMDDYITKPIKRNDFLMTVQRWICRGKEEPAPAPIEAPVESEGESLDQSQSLDYQAALDEFMGNEQVLIGVLEGFVKNVEMQLPSIRQAVVDRNFELFRKEAHSIKGGAGNLSAAALSRLAAELEQLGKDQNLTGIEPLLIRFESEFSRLKQIVNAHSRRMERPE
jgi:PAS domain S-box-containing protein